MKYRKPNSEAKTRRISIRVSSTLYRELDDKRHALDRNWQTIGMGLWLEWLRSTADPADNFYGHHRAEHELLDYVLKQGTAKHAEWITGNLTTFRDAIQKIGPGTSKKELGKLIREYQRAEKIRKQFDGKQESA